MAFDAGAAAAKIGLDISDYTKGMLQAQSLASLFPATITNFIANPLLGLIGVAKQAGQALVSLFNESASQADNLGEMAANIGVSVEALSGLGLVAGQAGSSLEGVADAFKFLGRNAAEAASGNKTAAAAFTDLGIAVTGADGQIRPLEQMMFDVADALAKLPAGGQRAKAAMDLLGRGGTELVGALSQGSAAIKDQILVFDSYGAVVTAKAAASGGAWMDAMDEMGKSFSGFKNLLAEPLRDMLMPYLNDLLQWVRTNPEQIRETIVSVMGVVGVAIQMAGNAVKFLVDNFDVIGPVAAVVVGAIAGIVAVMRTLAIAQAIVQALAGPAGWAALAVGATVAAGAVVGVEKAFAGAKQEMTEFHEEMNRNISTPGASGPGAAGGGYASAGGSFGAGGGGSFGAGGGGDGGGPPINVNVSVADSDSYRQVGEKIVTAAQDAKRDASEARQASLRERALFGL